MNLLPLTNMLGDWVVDWSWNGEAVLRLIVASALGAAIGLEREHHGRGAGFRTQLLVSLGSALAMLVSLHFGLAYGDRPATDSIRVDPARVAYGVMGGIGFLGAGAIIRHGFGIRGLTTAASLWCTAAVGLACGVGCFVIAATATLVALFALFVLSKLDRFIPTRWYKSITLTLRVDHPDNISRIRKLFEARDVHIVNLDYVRDHEHNTETLTCYVRLLAHHDVTDLTEIGTKLPDLLKIHVE